MTIPAVLQIILWIAAGLTALGVIYVKGLRPLARFIAETERSVPVLRSVTDQLNDPVLVAVIVDMARQFKSDSGSTLRDSVNRLEASADKNERVIDGLSKTVDGYQQQIAHLLVELGRLQGQTEHNTGRILASTDTAVGLVAEVKQDLMASHDRASAAGGEPGQSADAFSTPPKEPS